MPTHTPPPIDLCACFCYQFPLKNKSLHHTHLHITYMLICWNVFLVRSYQVNRMSYCIAKKILAQSIDKCMCVCISFELHAKRTRRNDSRWQIVFIHTHISTPRWTITFVVQIILTVARASTAVDMANGSGCLAHSMQT